KKLNVKDRRSCDFRGFFNLIFGNIQHLNAFVILPDPKCIVLFFKTQRIYGNAHTGNEISQVGFVEIPLNYKTIAASRVKAMRSVVRNNCINTVSMTGKSIYFANVHALLEIGIKRQK